MTISLPDFSHSRIIVVGDLMLDRSWYGDSRRISPEAPVPVVHVHGDEHRAGGAGNVARNIAALGGKVHLLGIIGDDENGCLLEGLLEDAGIAAHLHRTREYSTCQKLRIIAQRQQMIRLDFEESFAPVDKRELLASYRRLLDDADLVILSDYNKGTLSEITRFIRPARNLRKPVIIDPKGTDFEKYQGATLLTPNLAEFENVSGPCLTGKELDTRGEKLRRHLQLDALLVTRGAAGMSLFQRERAPFHLPAHTREVFDVTGAGDTVVGTTGLMLTAGASLEEAVTMANLAASLVVAKLGTATVTPAELHRAILEPATMQYGIVDAAALEEIMRQARSRGEKIVMTNGCFDLLHAGHLSCLQQARQLGDRLVVAVNSDDSVARLKGENRPINPLNRRMALLAGLKCVDWVVSFSEDTPAELYRRLQPDILVKGGDYSAAEVAGGEHVTRRGGSIEIIDLLPDISTSDLIRRIRTGRNRE